MDSKDGIHVLSLGLMVISLILAIAIPFELFLLAYAVLGPLHYLTEINWLKKNGFYIKKVSNIWILVILTLLISIPIGFRGAFQLSEDPVVPILGLVNRFYATIVLMMLIIAIGLVYPQKRVLILTLILTTGLIIFLFRNTKMYQLLAGMLLPSLVHVYFFTLLFMVYGVTKTKNRMGILEVLILSIVPLIVSFLPISLDNYALSNKILITFRESNFGNLNSNLGIILGYNVDQYSEKFIFSEVGVRIQIFIAFAYIYHYLNWFSKVSLIGWLKNNSFRNISILILLWILSISLYFYDYRLGLALLFFLSLLHVTLEFPLNILSIQGVCSFILSQFRSNR